MRKGSASGTEADKGDVPRCPGLADILASYGLGESLCILQGPLLSQLLSGSRRKYSPFTEATVYTRPRLR